VKDDMIFAASQIGPQIYVLSNNTNTQAQPSH